MIERADHDGIAILTLNHGPVNALDLELLRAIPGSLAAVADSRGVVLTGSGRSFSAGVDLKQIVDGGLPYVAARASVDPQVLRIWGSGDTSQALRGYLASLRRG